MKRRKQDAASVFISFVVFVVICVVSFGVLKNPPPALKYVPPYGQDALQTVKKVIEAEKRLEEIGYDGSTLRADIQKNFPYISTSSLNMRTNKENTIITADVKGIIKIHSLNDFFKALDRPGMRVDNLKLSSRLNFSHTARDDLNETVFDLSLTASYIRRQ